MDWKNILERAGWTFLQAGLAVVVAADALDITVWKAAAVAGVAAVLSLVKTIAQEKLAQ